MVRLEPCDGGSANDFLDLNIVCPMLFDDAFRSGLVLRIKRAALYRAFVGMENSRRQFAHVQFDDEVLGIAFEKIANIVKRQIAHGLVRADTKGRENRS